MLNSISNKFRMNLGEMHDLHCCQPCGYYHRLNDTTMPDRYPIHHIHDFSLLLAENIVFSKINLVRGSHQIPVASPGLWRCLMYSIMQSVILLMLFYWHILAVTCRFHSPAINQTVVLSLFSNNLLPFSASNYANLN